MTDTITELRQVDPATPPPRGRGPLLALAVAAAVILIVGVAAFSVLSGDEQPVATDPPVTTTTTAPPPTTVAPQSSLPADTPPLDVASALALRWDNADATAARALFHPDVEMTEAEFAGLDKEMWYRWATRMDIERECEPGDPVELAGVPLKSDGAVRVTCVDTLTSGVQPGVVVGGGTWAVEVADGWVRAFFISPDYVSAQTEIDGIIAYRSWMQEYIPDRHDQLFGQASLAIVIDTPEAREAHRELVPFFVADTGPRPEQALPADTPLLEVVAEFQRRFAAGDVEGYEAIINPAIGYPSGNDAPASWFAAVTGITTERTCTEVDAITVRCTEIAYSGLAPGQLVGDTTVEYVGRAGWILAVQFPEGRPEAMSDPTDAVGVAEYRDWVEANAPDEMDRLFFRGLVMRLDTPELRAQHQTMIADYLAATG